MFCLVKLLSGTQATRMFETREKIVVLLVKKTFIRLDYPGILSAVSLDFIKYEHVYTVPFFTLIVFLCWKVNKRIYN